MSLFRQSEERAMLAGLWVVAIASVVQIGCMAVIFIATVTS